MMSISRDLILESAAQVFCQKGYNGASMADIAKVVGLQKATLYHHFGSKQEILAELLDRAMEIVTENMTQVLLLDCRPDEKIKLAMRAYLQVLCEQPDLSSVLLLEYRSLEKELYKRHIVNRDKFEKLWRDLIREGVDSGTLRSESVSMTVRAMLGVMNWTITWYRSEGKLSGEEIADMFSNLFLDGISTKKRTARKVQQA
jgi:TetR/AcrR family transcriptional regulator, cholesterol catabolism regulator